MVHSLRKRASWITRHGLDGTAPGRGFPGSPVPARRLWPLLGPANISTGSVAGPCQVPDVGTTADCTPTTAGPGPWSWGLLPRARTWGRPPLSGCRPPPPAGGLAAPGLPVGATERARRLHPPRRDLRRGSWHRDLRYLNPRRRSLRRWSPCHQGPYQGRPGDQALPLPPSTRSPRPGT